MFRFFYLEKGEGPFLASVIKFRYCSGPRCIHVPSALRETKNSGFFLNSSHTFFGVWMCTIVRRVSMSICHCNLLDQFHPDCIYTNEKIESKKGTVRLHALASDGIKLSCLLVKELHNKEI